MKQRVHIEEIEALIEALVKGDRLSRGDIDQIEAFLAENPDLPKNLFYQGPAFRVLFIPEGDRVDSYGYTNLSWTKKDGRRFDEFVEEKIREDKPEWDKQIIVLDGDIFGLDINEFIFYCQDQGIFITTKFLKEEEVLSLESKIVNIIKYDEEY